MPKLIYSAFDKRSFYYKVLVKDNMGFQIFCAVRFSIDDVQRVIEVIYPQYSHALQECGWNLLILKIEKKPVNVYIGDNGALIYRY